MVKFSVLLILCWIPVCLTAQVNLVSSVFVSLGSSAADGIKGSYSTSDGGFVSLVAFNGQARMLKSNAQLDTVQSMLIPVNGFEAMDFRMDSNGYLHAL